MTEEQLQQQIFIWFNNNYCLKNQEPRGIIFSVANESTYNNKKFKNTGVLSGVSDMILILPNKQLIFMELKTEKGKQSEKQIEFQQRVELLGFEYWLIRSLEDFKSKVYEKTS
jgi:hypothetical protein